MENEYLPIVCLAARITIRELTGELPFSLIFGHHAVNGMWLEPFAVHVAPLTIAIDNAALLQVGTARQLKWWQEDINTAIQFLKELRDANQCDIHHAVNYHDEDLQISNMAFLHKTQLRQTQGSKLNARWHEPNCVIGIAKSLRTYPKHAKVGTDLTGWIDGS